MEDIMTQFPETRRRRDGSIDIDYYRARAMAARGEALRDSFKLKAAFGFVLITLTTIVFVTVAASAPTHWASRLIAFSTSAVSAMGRSVQ
jgi:hypothetical protein